MSPARSSPPPGPVPATPPEAAEVFGARLHLAQRYVELLADTGITHGLIGPREAPRLWSRHVLNSAVVAPAFDPDATVADLGSGAGLPGIPLAIARPDLQVTLVEPLQRRVTWLGQTLDELATLGLDNVTVLRARAEQLAPGPATAPTQPPPPPFRHVTARAVARTAALARMSVALLELGGSIHALKGSRAATELEEDAEQVRDLGFVQAQVREYGEGIVDPPTVLVSLVLGAEGAVSTTRPMRRSPRRTRRGSGGRRT